MNITVYLADQNPERDRSRGITNMTDVLLRCMLGHTGLRIATIASRSSYALDDGRIQKKVLPWRSDGAVGRLLADNIHTLFAPRRPDVWFYPKGFLPFLRRPTEPCVGVIHDTILSWSYDRYPEERSRINYLYWIENLKRSVKRFDLVLTDSNSSKIQILELCDSFHIRPPAIRVVYGSAGEIAWPANTDKADYVIHIASKAPHKRTAWFINKWMRAFQAGRELPRLLLIGSLPEGLEKLITEVDGIEKLPFLSEEDYRQAIAAARALILPSEIEGFGLPALEAYLLGTPVCYVEGTAVDEILAIPGSIGSFTLSSSESLFTAIDDVLHLGKEEVAKTSARLRKMYDPNRFAERVVNILRDLV